MRSWIFSSSNLQVDENNGLAPDLGLNPGKNNNRVGLVVGLSVYRGGRRRKERKMNMKMKNLDLILK